MSTVEQTDDRVNEQVDLEGPHYNPQEDTVETLRAEIYRLKCEHRLKLSRISRHVHDLTQALREL